MTIETVKLILLSYIRQGDELLRCAIEWEDVTAQVAESVKRTKDKARGLRVAYFPITIVTFLISWPGSVSIPDSRIFCPAWRTFATFCGSKWNVV